MITQLALIAVGGAVGAVLQSVVVDRFGARWGGAGLAVVVCTLFGACWALTDPSTKAYWAITDRETAAPVLYGLLAAAAPLSAVLSGDISARMLRQRDWSALLVRGLVTAVGVLIVAAAAMLLGYLSIRGGYTLYFKLTRG